MTFPQWRDARIAERVAEYGCTRSEAAYGLCAADWWKDHIQPSLKPGVRLSWAVCRSIAENGYRLIWIEKHYEGALPRYCDVKTGKQLPKGLR